MKRGRFLQKHHGISGRKRNGKLSAEQASQLDNLFALEAMALFILVLALEAMALFILVLALEAISLFILVWLVEAMALFILVQK